MRKLLFGLVAAALLFGMGLAPFLGAGGSQPALAAAKGSIAVVSPKEGEKITSTDIPVTVQVNDFTLSGAHVGMPDVDGEGHIHVMIDGMNMGVLFNFYTTPTFTLPGDAIKPGAHTLIFTLASNTHMDHEETVKQVKIDYQPTTPKPAPAAAAATTGAPEVKLVTPADGATVGPRFAIQVKPSNFTASLGLEGKPNLKGFGHYHVFVDMDMSSMNMSGGMMSMAGMVSMPGGDNFEIDLTAWKNGKHTITVEAVQNDHTPIEATKPVMFTVNLQGAAGTGPVATPQQLPKAGGTPVAAALPYAIGVGLILIAGGLGLRRRLTIGR